MRTRSVLASVLAGALFLAACGGDSSGDEAASPSETGTETSTEAGTAAPSEAGSQPELVSEDLPEGVAATVGDTEISVEDLEQRVAAVREVPQVAQQLESGENTDQVEAQLQSQALGGLVLQELVLQGAASEDVQVDEQQVDERRTELVEEAGGEDAFAEQLATSGIPESQLPDELRASIAFEVVTTKLLEAEGIDPDAATATPEPQATGTEAPSANPEAQQASQIQQDWLFELVNSGDVVVDEAYGAWNPQSGQVVPA